MSFQALQKTPNVLTFDRHNKTFDRIGCLQVREDGCYLHSRLHHVQRGVAENTGRSSRCAEYRRDNRVHFPPRVVLLYINCTII